MRLSLCIALVIGMCGWLGGAGAPAPLLGQEPAAPAKADASKLVGTWRVDLRPKPGDPPYYQELVVKSVDGTKLVGTFYNSELQDGRLNLDWGTVHFAFTTNDARERGIYNTAGRLVGDRLEGTTHSIGREFLAVWTAVRQPETK